MGSNQSSSVKQVTEVLSKNVTNIVSKQAQNTSGTQININSISVVFGEKSDISGCSITGTQRIKGSQTIDAISQYQSTSDIQNLISSAVDATATQNQKAVSEFLSTTFGNQNSSTDIRNTLQNTIENNITNENTQDIKAMVQNLNDGKWEFLGKVKCGANGKIDISQEIVMEQFVKAVTGLATEALMKNEEINKAVTKTETSQTAENKGIGDAISKALSGWAMMLLIPLIIIVVLIVFLPKILNSSGAKSLLAGKGGSGGLLSSVEKNPGMLAFGGRRRYYY